MKTESLTYNLTPAGYLIVLSPENARDSNDYTRRFGLYAGVDRLPPKPAPDRATETFLGKDGARVPELESLADTWLYARLEAGEFIPDLTLASWVRNQFQSFGLQYDLVYCELAWRSGEEDRLKAYQPVLGGPPTISETYGFDISWPSCTHSAILQPGVVPGNPTWLSRLNQYGLLSEYDDAVTLRDRYLRVCPCPPFDIYLVHKLRLDSSSSALPSGRAASQ